MLKGEILFWSLISYWSCTPLLLLASSWTCLFPVPLMWFNESSKLQYACSKFTEREPPSHKWRLIPRGVCSERWQFEMDWWYWTLSMQATAVCRILYGLHTENMHWVLVLHLCSAQSAMLLEHSSTATCKRDAAEGLIADLAGSSFWSIRKLTKRSSLIMYRCREMGCVLGLWTTFTLPLPWSRQPPSRPWPSVSPLLL